MEPHPTFLSCQGCGSTEYWERNPQCIFYESPKQALVHEKPDDFGWHASFCMKSCLTLLKIVDAVLTHHVATAQRLRVQRFSSYWAVEHLSLMVAILNELCIMEPSVMFRGNWQRAANLSYLFADCLLWMMASRYWRHGSLCVPLHQF